MSNGQTKHSGLGGKILCDQFLFTVDYHGQRSELEFLKGQWGLGTEEE
jgi:hypothetical protein